MLADFIVATADEAAAYDGEAPHPDSHRARYNGFTEVELGTLHHIAQGKDLDDEALYDFPVVRVVDEGQQLTIELLPELVARLASASDADLATWSTPWAETEELECEGEEVLPVLQDLRRLSKLAQAESKSVYLWNSM